MDSFNLKESFDFDITNEFEQLKKAFTCGKCNNLMVKPVNLNTCGHIQCELCLDSKKLQCSICKYPYNEIDVTESAIIESAIKSIKNIENIGTKISIENGQEKVLDGDFEIVITQTPMKKNHKGETPLHLVCKKGKLNKVEELISSGVDINATDWGNWSPLHEAVHSRHYNCVEALLKNRALINIPGVYYMTPLHEAVSSNAENIIELLLKYGADKYAMDNTGLTPFDYVDNTKLTNLRNLTPSEIYTPKVFVNKQIVAYTQTLSQDKISLLTKYGVKFVNWMDFIEKDDVTHLITLEKVLNLSLLFGILKGIFIVDKKWTSTFPLKIVAVGQIPGVRSSTIKNSIKNKLERRPKLFSDINFHIINHENKTNVNHVDLTKANLAALIEIGGGKVVSRSPALRTVENGTFKPYHARDTNKLKECCNYIIYDEKKEPVLMYNMKELQHKSSKWLIDCILQFKILD